MTTPSTSHPCYAFAMNDLPPSQQMELRSRFEKRNLDILVESEKGIAIATQLRDAYNRKRRRSRVISQASRDHTVKLRIETAAADAAAAAAKATIEAETAPSTGEVAPAASVEIEPRPHEMPTESEPEPQPQPDDELTDIFDLLPEPEDDPPDAVDEPQPQAPLVPAPVHEPTPAPAPPLRRVTRSGNSLSRMHITQQKSVAPPQRRTIRDMFG